MSARLERITKVLHDDLGPTLCGVGLQVELLLGEQGRDIMVALEKAVDQVRRLSYLAHEDLAGKFGLAKAVELLPDFAAPTFRGRVLVIGMPSDQQVFEDAAEHVFRLSKEPQVKEICVSFGPHRFTAEGRPCLTS
jgi:hypothetical protein